LAELIWAFCSAILSMACRLKAAPVLLLVGALFLMCMWGWTTDFYPFGQ
jgi:hypothetical protein